MRQIAVSDEAIEMAQDVKLLQALVQANYNELKSFRTTRDQDPLRFDQLLKTYKDNDSDLDDLKALLLISVMASLENKGMI